MNCCTHDCEQGDTCPIRAQRKLALQEDPLARLKPTPAQQQRAQAAIESEAKERAKDSTCIAWGRVLLAAYFAGVFAFGLYLSLS